MSGLEHRGSSSGNSPSIPAARAFVQHAYCTLLTHVRHILSALFDNDEGGSVQVHGSSTGAQVRMIYVSILPIQPRGAVI